LTWLTRYSGPIFRTLLAEEDERTHPPAVHDIGHAVAIQVHNPGLAADPRVVIDQVRNKINQSAGLTHQLELVHHSLALFIGIRVFVMSSPVVLVLAGDNIL
jgi:hypothetical protein